MGDWIRTGRALACAAAATPWIRVTALIVGLVATATVAAQPRDATTVAPFTGTLQKIYEQRRHPRRASRELAALRLPRCPAPARSATRSTSARWWSRRSPSICAGPSGSSTSRSRRPIASRWSATAQSTSNAARPRPARERRALVDFSPTIFVTGTKLLVRRGSGIRSLRDLQGKTVVLTQRHDPGRGDTEDRRSGRSWRSGSSSPATTTSRSRRWPRAGPMPSPTTTCSCTA